MLEFLSGLDRRRYQAFVVVPREGPFTERLNRIGIPFFVRAIHHWIPFGQRRDWSYLKRLRFATVGIRERVWSIAGLVDRLGIDIVYTNTITAIEGALAAWRMNRPHVWHIRENIKGNQDIASPLPRCLISWIVGALSKTIIFNSHKTASNFRCSPLLSQVEVIHNGVDISKYSASSSETVGSFLERQAPKDRRVVAIIGTISPRKGLDVFLEAANRILSLFPDTLFLVIGDGEPNYVQKIQDRATRDGLNASVRFLGRREDICEILTLVDVLVVAADQEPFGRTVVEAMSASIPVVSTRCGGPEEIIIDGLTGLLVPKRDPDAMASAVGALLSDTERAKRMGEAGRRRARDVFSSSVYVSGIERVLSEAVGSRDASTST
jgi:glycosyltransferase involved in cell wall biosynthesis